MTGINHKTISAQEAQDMLAEGNTLLIDVREPDEFKSKHIPYAQSIPLAQIDQLERLMKISPNKKIIFQCLGGKRGEQACLVANSHNIKNDIYNMEGGLNAWVNAGLPLIISSN